MLVAQEWRHRGVGTALGETLLGWAGEHPQIERVGLTVVSVNAPALNLYRKCGFREEGRLLRRFRLGDGEYVDDIPMVRFVK